MAITPSLRERKKQDTRRRLREAAVELFLERGVETTTVAEVAARAGVSVATLFTYVPEGKAALVFEGEENRKLAINEALADRSSATVLDALEKFIFARGPFRRAERSAIDELIASTPQLKAYARSRWQSAVPEVAAALAKAEVREVTVEDLALARFALDIPDIAGATTDPRGAVKALFARLGSGWNGSRAAAGHYQ